MGAFLDRHGVAIPIVQAGMGGGVSRHELAAAVSEAGGLGTIGFIDADALARELAAARRLTAAAIAVNLLLPFARRGHWEAARDADVVVTFWGRPRRRTPGPWIHQCGSVEEALGAWAAGADAVLAQGREAGGHVRGTVPALDLLERVRRALPAGYPVLAAGGIAGAGDVGRALEAGAEAAVLGTRFLMSEESRAHGVYKDRLVRARKTHLTELFGAGWPAPHRVIANAATERWLRGDPRGPRPIRLANRLTAPLARRMPAAAQARLAALQRPGQPILSPQPPVDDGPAGLVDAGPLYAGVTVARIEDVRPAGALVADLARG